ncbi:MAG: alpha/beta fold hydrolase [Desulfobacterales bacterium]
MLDRSSWEKKLSIVEKYVQVSDGVQIKIIDFTPPDSDPEKPVVVFVAGWISLLSGWEQVLKVITPRLRLLYIETREKKSARLPEGRRLDFSIERMSADIHEILSEVFDDSRRFYFAGSSLGATVILDYLSMHGKKSAGAFLIAPISKFAFPKWLLFIIKFIPASLYSFVRPILKGYLKYFRLDRKNEQEQIKKYEGTIDAAEPARLKANAYAIKDYTVWGKLENIETPVVIIGAETDNLHGIEEMEKMVSSLPSARLKIMRSNKETHSEAAGNFILTEISSR